MINGTGTNRDNSYLIGNKFAQGNKPNQTAFKKGSIPWNKGLSMHLSPMTEFKKGQSPPVKYPVGTVVKRTHKGDGSRQWIKIAEPNKWEEYAKFLWKRQYGKIIRGDIVHHINGNKLDDRLENLICLPRCDHPIFHSRWGLKKFTDEQFIYYIARYGSFWENARNLINEHEL